MQEDDEYLYVSQEAARISMDQNGNIYIKFDSFDTYFDSKNVSDINNVIYSFIITEKDGFINESSETIYEGLTTRTLKERLTEYVKDMKKVINEPDTHKRDAIYGILEHLKEKDIIVVFYEKEAHDVDLHLLEALFINSEEDNPKLLNVQKPKLPIQYEIKISREKAKTLLKELGIININNLTKEDKAKVKLILQKLPGFGDKTVNKIMEEIKQEIEAQ